MVPFSPPEIHRIPLDSAILDVRIPSRSHCPLLPLLILLCNRPLVWQVLCLHVARGGDVFRFPWIEPPPHDNIAAAIHRLSSLSAVRPLTPTSPSSALAVTPMGECCSVISRVLSPLYQHVHGPQRDEIPAIVV